MSHPEDTNIPTTEANTCYHGPCIVTYRGAGILTLADGCFFGCTFEAGQAVDGTVWLICRFQRRWPEGKGIPVRDFTGTTTTGWLLSADRPILYFQQDVSKAEGGSVECWGTCCVSKMLVRVANNSHPREARYGIMNLGYTQTHKTESMESTAQGLSLRLQAAHRVTEVIIRPLEKCMRLMERYRIVRDVHVAHEVCGALTDDQDIDQLTDVVNGLCRLLSVACGTSIQWVYRDLYDSPGELVAREHRLTPTGPRSGLALIDSSNIEDTKAFLEQSYGNYVAIREAYMLDKGVLDAYLDAKMEPYCVMGGLKLAIAIEMLKSVFLDVPDFPVRESILPNKQFKNLTKSMAQVIDRDLAGKADENAQRTLRDNLPSINRTPFKSIVKALCAQIGLERDVDIDLFVKCRNSLVHTGKFYCFRASRAEKEKYDVLAGPDIEYFFLVHFLDRVFMALLGYRGPYLNWLRAARRHRMAVLPDP